MCFNQEDLEEKSSQVALMADIYRHAARTLICVGGDNDWCANTTQEILDYVDTDHISKAAIVWDTSPDVEGDDLVLSDSRWKSVHPLTDRSDLVHPRLVRPRSRARARRPHLMGHRRHLLFNKHACIHLDARSHTPDHHAVRTWLLKHPRHRLLY